MNLFEQLTVNSKVCPSVWLPPIVNMFVFWYLTLYHVTWLQRIKIYIYIYELKLRSYGPGQCTKVLTGYIKHSIIIENESEHTIYWCITPNYLIDIRR